MRLRNVPRRAIRKLRDDGVSAFVRDSSDFLLDDLFYYRLLYQRRYRNQIDVLNRPEFLERSTCKQYGAFDLHPRVKSAAGARSRNNPKRYDPEKRAVCTVPDATLFGPSGPGCTDSGAVLADTVGSPPMVDRRVGVTIAQSMRRNGIRRTLGVLSGDDLSDHRLDTATLAIPPWLNYYHWTVECLFRIRLLEKYGTRTGTYPTLLIPPNPPGWVTESLELLGYTGKWRSWSGGIATVDNLVVPTFPEPLTPECDWLRNQMLDGLDPSDRRERIFVARDDATVRRVTNREQLCPVLDQFDIETYVLSNHSVEEQVRLFSRAELIVGPHGAGLTNLLYARDATVVELFGAKRMATFDRLSEYTNNDYYLLECSADGADIQVDPGAIWEVLDDVCD